MVMPARPPARYTQTTAVSTVRRYLAEMVQMLLKQGRYRYYRCRLWIRARTRVGVEVENG
jgi:hypothetical protein